MTDDPYQSLAERYDWMRKDDPIREKFFRDLFIRHGVRRLLDCACGTGRDLLMFQAMGLEVSGSDLSEAMLAEARKNTGKARIPLRRVDYRELGESYDEQFDAVVCLSNSINEPLEDAETLRALRSMRSVLRPSGILVFDQGQSDASMRNAPRFVPVVNERDSTRFFVIEYSGDVQTVHIFDFLHTAETRSFNQTAVPIRIRLRDSWDRILCEAGFRQAEFFGSWDGTTYDKQSSRRLIAIAEK